MPIKAVQDWLRGREPSSVVQDTAEQDLTPVHSAAQGCAPVATDADDCQLVLGSMRSAREHAELIVQMIRHLGLCGRAIYQGDIERMHAETCQDLAWLPKGWSAVCRELAKLPGVKRGQVKIEGHRLTAYEVEPAAEATNVVPLTERQRAS